MDIQHRHLIWELNDKWTNIAISKQLKVKRLEPYKEGDIKAIEEILNGTNPNDIKYEIISEFNSKMPSILN